MAEREVIERSQLLEKTSQGSRESLVQAADTDKGICIVVAGKPGNGKSTALNNLFSLNFPAKISCRSVTTKINKRSIMKNGINLTIVDTPGLGALDIDKEEITTAMVEALNRIDYTLLYCLSVGPGNRLTEMDKIIIQRLHFALGKEVWDKCVILFTFSDTARREGFSCADQVSDYKDYLKDMADEFHQVLQTCTSDVPAIKSIFEYEGSADILKRTEEKKVIVAIPVGKTLDKAEQPDILPDIIMPSTDDWTDLVFVESMRKTKPSQRRSFVIFKYGAAVTGGVASGAAVGAGIGAGIGAAVGILGGPVGEVVAVPVGAAIGAGVGAIASISIASIVTAIRRRKNKKCIKKLLVDEEFS